MTSTRYTRQWIRTTTTHEAPRAIITLIDQFDHKEKAVRLQEQATSMSMKQLDKLAADLMLRDTDKVIKI